MKKQSKKLVLNKNTAKTMTIRTELQTGAFPSQDGDSCGYSITNNCTKKTN